MDAKTLFLVSHSVVHSVAVGGNPGSIAERTFAGLGDEQMRVRLRDDLNSLAWIMWHIARIEDSTLNTVFSGQDQVFDGAWRSRLQVMRPDFGIGMTSVEVTELSRQIDLGALRDYRDAVGRRTREIVSGFNEEDWDGEIAAASLDRAAALGAFGTRRERYVKAFTGRPRAAVLSGVTLLHSSGHLGEAATVRSAGGFGSGV
jgi:DinB family protein